VSVALAWPVPEAIDEAEMRRIVPRMTCTLTRHIYVPDVTAQCRATWYQVIYGGECAPLRK
jgi:hypothetical protein